MENRNFFFTNDDEKAQKAPHDKIVAIKGATVSVAGSDAKASTEEWRLTAEHSGTEGSKGIGFLVAEFIVNGEKVQLGQGNGKRIGDEITEFLVSSSSPLHNPSHVPTGALETQQPRWLKT